MIVFLGMAVASAMGRRLRQVTGGTSVLVGSESWILLFAAASVTGQFLGRPKMGDLEVMLRTASASPG